uniref:Uncharacterized protein n=1 Tax=Anguilla anguilla TaxID=7936 RepID=A0A0E9VJ08_ANGAN
MDTSITPLLACQECETIDMDYFNYPTINWELMTRQGKSEEDVIAT